MKKTLLSALLALPLMFIPLLASAQTSYGNLSPLRTDGTSLKDIHGNPVRLHGVSDCPSPSANNNRWGEEIADANITRCTSYFTKVFSAITKTDEGTSANAFRLCLAPEWASDDAKVAEGLPYYQCLSSTRLKSNITKLYWKLIQAALKKGLYVIVAAPGECPEGEEAKGAYLQYVTDTWDVLTKNDSILKYSGQISLDMTASAGNLSQAEASELCQPAIEKVRANGFGGIIWTGGQDEPKLLNVSQWDASARSAIEYGEASAILLASTDSYVDMDVYSESMTVQPGTMDGVEDCWQCFAQLSERYPTLRPFRHFWTADQGNGTFINPILNGDFPDVDIIRVEDTYYLMATTMYIFPGATIMKSKDLVNWEYCCNPLEKIDDNDAYNLLNGKEHYAQGQWATSLTYHNGQFYVYFISSGRGGVDGGRNVLLTAPSAEGPWKMQYMNDWYYDSGWMFDDGPDGDGSLYVASCNWASGTIYMNKLDPKTLKKLSSATVINGRDGTEGARMYHIGKFYYIYLTTGGYWRGQTIYRSEKPMGPYEEMPNLNGYGNAQSGNAFSGAGVHQGGLVQTQTGEWWTIMFKDAGAIGRVPYLEPVVWQDGWPIIGNKGVEVSKNSKAYRKPNVGATHPRTYLPTNDGFNSLTLGKQWGWNHNHVDTKWSLLERPGHLRLHTVNVTNNLRFARNSLTQRIIGLNAEGTSSTKNVNSYGTIKMDVSGMVEGDVAGLAVYQDPYQLIGVTVRDGQKRLIYMTARSSSDWQPSEKLGAAIKSDTIYLRAIANFSSSRSNLYYSYDNAKWTKFGDEMEMRFDLSIFVGNRFYIFNYATKQEGGYVDIDWFSTEPTFEEDYFYGQDLVEEGYPAEEVTATSLKASQTQVEMMPGSIADINLTCTMQSGTKVDVSTGCQFEFGTPGVATCKGGRIVGLSEGETEVKATYTDALGGEVSVEFTLKVSYFPLTDGLLDANLIGTGGTVRNMTNYTLLKLARGGMGGWHYSQGLDLTGKDRYLMIDLARTVTTKPVLRIYDQNDLKATEFYASPEFGTDSTAVFDLAAAAETIDLSHIYYIGIYMKTASSLQLKNVYLSPDGQSPTAIQAIEPEPTNKLVRVEFFTPDGRQHDTLQPGTNLVRRTFSNGQTETLKIKK